MGERSFVAVLRNLVVRTELDLVDTQLITAYDQFVVEKFKARDYGELETFRMKTCTKSICYCLFIFCFFLPQLASGQTRNGTKQKSSADTVAHDKRREWVSLTYGSVIAYKNESRWTDTITATGKILSEMEFRGKTDDYVELFNLNPAARDHIRLYKDRMECNHATGWVVIGSGHWRTVTNSTLGIDGPAKAAGPAKSSAEILNVKIVREPNANGKSIRVIKITWKNTGSKTIRALDGNFFIADNTGTLDPKFEYTIFACSNLEDGVKPGDTFVLTEGGFVLPQGCTATEAKVEITKVLEKSNF